jgi:hypothetical protein
LKQSGRTVSIEAWSHYKEVTLPPTRYAEVKRFFDHLDEIGRRLIVLRELNP